MLEKHLAGMTKVQSKSVHGGPGIPADTSFQCHRRLSQASGGLHPVPSRPGPHRPPVARRASEHTEGSAETHGYRQECISGRGPHRWAPEPPLLTCAPRAGPSPSASPLCSHSLPRQRSRFNPEDPVPRICFTRGSRRPSRAPHKHICSRIRTSALYLASRKHSSRVCTC